MQEISRTDRCSCLRGIFQMLYRKGLFVGISECKEQCLLSDQLIVELYGCLLLGTAYFRKFTVIWTTHTSIMLTIFILLLLLQVTTSELPGNSHGTGEFF